MCGIVGILGNKPVANDIVDALRRLEYRGYDSAGVATVEQSLRLRRFLRSSAVEPADHQRRIYVGRQVDRVGDR